MSSNPNHLSNSNSNTNPKKIAFEVLGCRLNSYEGDALATKFREQGYQIVDSKEIPDIIILNTCSVTNQADRKSRHAIYRSLRQIELVPNGLVIVTGCFVASHNREGVWDDDLFQGENLYVVSNQQKSQIPEIVESHFKGELSNIALPAKSNPLFDFPPVDPIFHSRGMLKIQDGCDNFCTYCIIPQTRGAAISRPLPDILDDARKMVEEKGFKEIILTGVNMSYYTWRTKTFSDLLGSLLELDLDFRLRLSSLEPYLLDKKFLEYVHHPKLCEHLHLCLQSGSNRVLKSMKRLYTYEEFRDIVFKIREGNPLFNITTDVIVGFPGESEEDFQESLRAIEELRFGRVHTFRYSKRRGTEAALRADQVSEDIKRKRSELLRQNADIVGEEYLQLFLDKKVEVVIESRENEGFRGTTRHFLPIYLKEFPRSSTITGTDFCLSMVEGISPLKGESVLVGSPS